MFKEKNKKKTGKSHIATECDNIGEIAIHYGFTVIKPPMITPDIISKAKQFKEFDYYNDAEEKVALTEWYINTEQEKESQPVAVHYKKKQNIYGFEIMGSGKPTTEALILKCALAVLDECGYKDLYIDINTIGDRESITRFERELGSYFRKNAHTLPAKVRDSFRKNHYAILVDNSPEAREFKQNAPQPVSTLSDIGRIHFKEVLESIEAFDVMYKIKGSAISNRLYAAYTVFEIRELTDKSGNVSGDGTLLAYGYRYNHLAKKLGWKREIPSIGLTVMLKKHPALSKKVIIKNIKKPRFYLVQLGPSAKLKVLNIVEILRKHKIPVYHSITKDKITGQLSGAEYMKATHVLIIGQKEAMDNTVVVRNIITREQETVPVAKLAEFLKKL